MGLADVLVPQDQVRDAAIKLASEIGENSPLGLIATRMTMRNGIADRVRKATDHELEEQTRLRKTDDFKEGMNAVSERRMPNLKGRSSRRRATVIQPPAATHDACYQDHRPRWRILLCAP
jgi:1,4-dihydroxy-2-naphthoyl-CoA synthase